MVSVKDQIQRLKGMFEVYDKHVLDPNIPHITPKTIKSDVEYWREQVLDSKWLTIVTLTIEWYPDNQTVLIRWQNEQNLMATWTFAFKFSTTVEEMPFEKEVDAFDRAMGVL